MDKARYKSKSMREAPPFEEQDDITINRTFPATSFAEGKLYLLPEPVETVNSSEDDERGRILMTGGTGFLGLHLLRGFLLSGREVTLLAHAGGLPALERVRRFLIGSGDLKRLPPALISFGG